MDKRLILVVDDVEINRDMLRVIFEEQFDIIEAEDGQQAINILKKYADEICLMFLDLMMPVKTGIDVLKHLKMMGLSDTIPVIVITAENSVESDIKVYEYGAADIIYKPFSKRVVTRRALNIIELYANRRDIQAQLELRTKELMAVQKKVEKNNEFLVNALSSVVEFRSLESGLHTNRVKNFSRILLNTWRTFHPECEFSDHDIDLMVNASALHDIGKIAIPDEILLKPGRLTREEFETMKQHTVLGCEILENFKQEDNDFYKYCYEICRYHHERSDGRGYPDGLKGDEIPVWAQVVSVADVYDALVSPRVYKTPYEIPEAFRMIFAGECGTFSAELLECLEASKFEIIAATEEVDAEAL